MESVKDLAFEDLLERYGRLIHKYCRFSIDGFAYEDLYQELCIVLLRCQQMWDPGHRSSAKFSTYFVNAMKWKIGNLLYRATKRLNVWCSLSEADDDEQVTSPERLVDPCAGAELDGVALRLDLAKLSPRAQERCKRIMERRLRDVTFRVGDSELIYEIRRALAGYNQG